MDGYGLMAAMRAFYGMDGRKQVMRTRYKESEVSIPRYPLNDIL
jgi:hypothetical protein